MNQVFLKGRVSGDIDFKYVGPKNTPLAKFSLAVPDMLAPQDKDKIYWANMVAWGKAAEIIQKHLAKGSEVLFRGRMVSQKWEKDGVKHRKDEVVIESIDFCGSKGRQAEPEPEADIPW